MFKFLRGEEKSLLTLEPTQVLSLRPYRFQPENIEFCFQFGENEPVAFATGPNECTIRLTRTNDSRMIFTDNNGNQFKLFAREIENNA